MALSLSLHPVLFSLRVSAAPGAEVFQRLQWVSHYSLASTEWLSIPRSIFTVQPLGTEEGPGQELSLLPQTLQVNCVVG